MKRLLVVPALAVVIAFASCGSEMDELEGKVDEYCECVKKGDDCDKLGDEVNKMGKDLAKKLKDDDDKEGAKEMKKIYTKFRDCRRDARDKD
jgi:hypothetical protein